MTNNDLLPPLTIGGLHHLAVLVPDAEAAALHHERLLGWERMMDEHAIGEDAGRLGSVLGSPDATRFHTIILHNPEKTNSARIEFLDFDTPRGPAHVVAPGLHVASFRVADANQAWQRLLDGGATAVREPFQATVAGWSVKIASVRTTDYGLIEVVEFL